MIPVSEPSSLEGFEVVNPLTEADWDHQVAGHPDATVYHSAAWAAVLVNTYGFLPKYLVQRHDGKADALLAFMEVYGILGRKRGISLPFTDCCPFLLPLGDSGHDLEPRFLKAEKRVDLAVSSRLLAAAGVLARLQSWQQIEFRPKPDSEVPRSSSVLFANHEVSLAETDEIQQKQCGSATRRSLRQAELAGLPMQVGSDLPLVQAYYRLHCLTRRRQGSPPQPWRFFANLHKWLLSRGFGFVVLAGDSPVAGAVFLKFGRRAVYKFGASDGRSLDTRPNQRVMWTGLRHAASLGCSWMDLGRSSLANEGLRRFKQGWGAIETQLAYYCIDLHKNRLNMLKDKTSGWQVNCFKRLPVWTASLLGQVAYRYAA